MSSSSGHSNRSLQSKGAPEPIDPITSEKATRRKAAARWEAKEEYTLVLYLEQQIAAAGDGVNFAKKHFASAAQHLKDTFTVKRGGEKTASACHTKWGNVSVISYLCAI